MLRTLTRTSIALGAACFVSGCGATAMDDRASTISPRGAEKLERQLAGKVAGEPINCIPMRNADETIRISDDILLYRVSNRLVYRNDLAPSCSGLARNSDIMVVRTISTQLCDGDIINLVDRTSGSSFGGCALGKFTPYRTPTTAASN